MRDNTPKMTPRSAYRAFVSGIRLSKEEAIMVQDALTRIPPNKVNRSVKEVVAIMESKLAGVEAVNDV